MKIKALFALLLIIMVSGAIKGMPAAQKFDKISFYHVLKSGNIGEINSQLAKIEASVIEEKDAYEGVLLMRKAGLVKKPKDKLFFFKSGRIKFETAFLADSNNIEYHFLRLSIQEHAPAMVNYHSRIQEDSHYVGQFFRKLSPDVQRAILEYSKTSGALREEDLKYKE